MSTKDSLVAIEKDMLTDLALKLKNKKMKITKNKKEAKELREYKDKHCNWWNVLADYACPIL